MKNNKTCKIAVIGIGCFYPGAKSPAELWENVLARRQQFRRMPDVRLPESEYYDPDPNVPDKTYQNKAAVLDGYSFDWLGKRIPKKTFESTDIVHWLTLDAALEAIKDAGYSKENIAKDTTGVIIGNTLTGEVTRSNQMSLRWPYVKKALKVSLQEKGLLKHFGELEQTMEKYYKSVFTPTTEDSLAGGLANTIAGRVCNFLDLHGGGYIVDGACSSSLLAICTAANYLESGQMDMVIAGGVDISLDTFELIGFCKTGALTKDEMRVYDKAGKGFLPGEGCGIVVLKRLEDAIRDQDQIYATLNGWGVSSDGKGGITAPSSHGQAMALKRAHQKANLNTAELDFIEGHGTGTTVGDKTELEGINIALNHEKTIAPRSCGVTSFKSIVGHTKAAAGVGAFIKTVIAVNQRILPPIAGFKEANPVFNDTAQALYPIVHGEVRDPQSIITAGVSAMGFGGINSHAVLQSHDAPSQKFKPTLDEKKLFVSNQTSEVFFLAAKNKDALLTSIDELSKNAHGISYAELADYAYKINQEVDWESPLRCAIVANNPFELLRKLNVLKNKLQEQNTNQLLSLENDSIVFGTKKDNLRIGALYPGQGSQKINMTNRLVQRFDWAKDFVERASTFLEKEGTPGIKNAIFRPVDKVTDEAEKQQWIEELKQTNIAQPAIIIASLLWQKYLGKIGLQFVGATGHSLGELFAFYTAGFYNLDTLLRFAAFRGKAMAHNGSGSMASLLCNKEKTTNYLNQVTGYVTIANINAPEQTVISGEKHSIRQVITLAENDGITAKELPVSAAFHSELIAETAEAIYGYDVLNKQTEKAANFHLISSVTGQEVSSDEILNEYFAKQSVSQVNFVNAIDSFQEVCDVLIEVGPGKVLSSLTANITNTIKSFPVEINEDDDYSFNIMLANVFVRGAELNVSEIYKDRLIREFIPASEKEFIVNPLEKDFPPLSEDTNSKLENKTVLQESPLQSLLPDINLDQYLEKRGDFLKDIILADLKYTYTNQSIVKSTNEINEKPSISKVYNLQKSSAALIERAHGTNGSHASANKLVPIQNLTRNKVNVIPGEVAQTVFALVSNRTGFPVEQLQEDFLLLDDLNMDSIKAGSLLAELSKKYELQGKFTPSDYANASLGKIIKAISEQLSENTPVQLAEVVEQTIDQSQIVKDALLDLITEKTGFPREQLSPEFRLLDDLNLDSIKAGSLLAQVSKQFNVQESFKALEYSNASLEEIIAKISSFIDTKVSIKETNQPTTSIHETKNELETEDFNRVSSYTAEVIKENLPDNFINNTTNKNYGLVYSNHSQKLAHNIAASLKETGANVQLVDYTELASIDDIALESILVFLPQSSGEKSIVAETVELLSAIAKYSHNKNVEIAFIQNGDGYFSKNPLEATNTTPAISATSFAASVHLERPDVKIRALEFSKQLSFKEITKKIIAELNTNNLYSAAGYNSSNERHIVVYENTKQYSSHDRKHSLSKNDVVLVTGGAKGITAECALALATQYKCKMALVGSSGLSDEIQEILNRYTANHLTAAYYSCNITDSSSVKELVKNIEKELGPVTSVIHGAGMNKPRRSEQVTAEEAYKEISPKLLGLLNLIEALQLNQLKYFIAFTSVIGVTGMPGNSWYAFSNETVDLLLRNLKKEKGVETITFAYSVWSEVGMGARMGSTKTLANMGIGSINPKDGIQEFLHWIQNQSKDQQIVISAKMGGLDTWHEKQYKLPQAKRFLEEIIHLEIGKELIAQVSLNRKDDKYIDDHNFNGSLLFPTVFGLEAMTQAAAAVTNNLHFSSLRLENISLLRPIVVPNDGETRIQVHAKVDTNPSICKEIKVLVGISTEDSNYTVDHFSAEIIFNPELEKQSLELNIPIEPLHLEPKTDLYSWLLFQGPLYQNIDKVYTLESGSVIFSTKNFESDASELCLSKEKLTPFILGNPLIHDLLLQSAQLTLTDKSYLPIKIKQWEVYKITNNQNTYIQCKLLELTESEALCEVNLIDVKNSNIIEKITGYISRALKLTPTYPTPDEIGNKNFFENKILQALKINIQNNEFKTELFVFKHSELFNAINKNDRHLLEQEIFTNNYLPTNTFNLNNENTISWLTNGQPIIKNSNLQISLSHSRSILLMTIGESNQGCDIEFVESKSREEWLDLLGHNHTAILSKLQQQDTSLDIAATRIWCTKEAVFKAFGVDPHEIVIEEIHNDRVVFIAKVNDKNYQITTISLELMPKNFYVFSLVFQLKDSNNTILVNNNSSISYSLDLMDNNMSLDSNSKKFLYNFYTTFKDCKSFYGKTYFTNFASWMGEIRELSLAPISKQLLVDLSSGEYGMVTNTSSIKVYSETEALKSIVGKVWATKKSDFENSFIDLCFEWYKLDKNDNLIKIADCTLSSTWVKIESHGIVKKVPMPKYLLDFLKDLPVEDYSEKNDSSNDFSQINLGKLFFNHSLLGKNKIQLRQNSYSTSISDSNSVGNIYYSNYYEWQAKSIEKLIYTLQPKLFSTHGKLGEYICIESNVNHLQEAMPFEEIEVCMYLEEVYENGFKLHFEYFSISEGSRRKLAYGNNAILWAKRDNENSLPTPQKLPEEIQDYFLQLANKKISSPAYS